MFKFVTNFLVFWVLFIAKMLKCVAVIMCPSISILPHIFIHCHISHSRLTALTNNLNSYWRHKIQNFCPFMSWFRDDQHCGEYVLVSADNHNKYHKLCGLNNRNLVSHSLGCYHSKTNILTVSDELFLACRWPTFFSSMVQKESSILYRD